MISVFLVDDEEPARSELKFLLQEIPGIKVIGTARNGPEAINKVLELRPQVVFMDIQMPGMSGLEVAQELVTRMKAEEFPLLVFATAFDQHALAAFENNAIDYVLKPFSRERLAFTMDKVKRLLDHGNAEKQKIDKILSLLEKPAAKHRLAVEDNEHIILLNPEEIVACSISGRTVKVKTQDREYATGHSLSELEEEFNLLRTHKSYVVNPDMVREVIPWFNGTMNLVMNDKEKSVIPVSRTYVKEVKNYLKI